MIIGVVVLKDSDFIRVRYIVGVNERVEPRKRWRWR